MKHLLSIIIVMLSFAGHTTAFASTGNSVPSSIGMNVIRNQNSSAAHVHRSLINIPIDAFYDTESNSIYISYYGDSVGLVYLYLNDAPIECDTEINTSFQLPALSGCYRIEVVTENWTAQGTITI